MIKLTPGNYSYFVSSNSLEERRINLNSIEKGQENISIEIKSGGNFVIQNHTLPTADNTYNLGAVGKRWANLYTADIHLNNEGSEGNEVDGTTGNWNIQEGEDDLYLLNRKSGKKYRFKLEEIE